MTSAAQGMFPVSAMGATRQRILFYFASFLSILTPAAADDIRLAGSTRCSGRVEVYFNNSWGTVCDDNWGLDDAAVVCRQVGCGTALEASKSAHFGEGPGEIWLDDVACSGSERSLTECEHEGFGIHDCRHNEDAGVVCSGVPVRLAGSTRCSGRVEVHFNNSWGTVCDDNWDLDAAEVVCREVGCGTALEAPQSAHFGEGTGPIWFDDVTCSGNETSLTQCQHRGLGTHNCEHVEDAGVICTDSIRLAGSTRCSGRVEIYFNNSWGTVCDDNWDLDDAAVVCRQVGCGTALEVSESARFGEGIGEIWLDEVACSGSERSLTECEHEGFGIHNCKHAEDAGVVCSGVPVRLAGSTQCSGRVELYFNNSWGTVCDDNWDLDAAEVVCREVGCGTALEASESAHFGEGTGEIWIDDVTCSGSERSLTECEHEGFGIHNCKHGEDAGVICSVPSKQTVSSVAFGILRHVLPVLLVTLVVGLILRRRRQANQQITVTHSSDGDAVRDGEERSYVNNTAARVKEEESGAQHYDYVETEDSYVVPIEVPLTVNEEEAGDDSIYANVQEPFSEQTVG